MGAYVEAHRRKIIKYVVDGGPGRAYDSTMSNSYMVVVYHLAPQRTNERPYGPFIDLQHPFTDKSNAELADLVEKAGSEYTHVATITCEADSPNGAAERAWFLTSSIDSAWYESDAAGLTVPPKIAQGCRSSMVGDLFVVINIVPGVRVSMAALLCSSFGFTDVGGFSREVSLRG